MSAFLIVRAEVEEASREAFDRWYENEHLPMKPTVTSTPSVPFVAGVTSTPVCTLPITSSRILRPRTLFSTPI